MAADRSCISMNVISPPRGNSVVSNWPDLGPDL